MAELKEVVEKFSKEWNDYKEANDKAIAAGEEKSAVHIEKMEKINDRLCDLEKTINKPDFGAQYNKAVESEEGQKLHKGFIEIMKKGDQASPDTFKLFRGLAEKTMIVGDDTTGGIFAPAEMLNEKRKDVVEISQFRSVARVRNTSRRARTMPVRTRTASAEWVGEAGQQDETQNPLFSMKEIPTHKIYARADITNEDLEDPEFNIVQFLLQEFSEQFALAEGSAFINGDGIVKPEGILFDTTNTQKINSGTLGAVTANGIIKTFYNGLKSAYWNNTQWLMNRKTIGEVRQLKDTSGRYLFDAGYNGSPSPLAQSAPGTLLGRPLLEMPDMPDVGNNTTPIALGDWKQSYIIADRIQTASLRDM